MRPATAHLWVLPGIAAMALALSGLPPGATAGDSGELAAAAFLLGTGHPPGQSFYLLVVKAVSLLFPFGTVPFRLGLLSALATGAAVAAITRLAWHLSGAFPAMIAGLTLLLLPPVRDAACQAEVYPLFWVAAALLLTGVILSPRLAAIGAGMAAAMHPEGLLFFPAAALGGAGRLLLLALVPSAVLIYPWLRLAAGSTLSWWLTANWPSSVAFITAAPYRGPRILALWYPDRLARLADLGEASLPLLPWLLLAAFGWRLLAPPARRAVAAIAVTDVLYASLVNPIPPSITPALVPLALTAAVCASLATARAPRHLRPAALLLLSLPALLSLLTPASTPGRRDHLAGDMAAAIAAPLPPVSTVTLGTEDNDLFPLMPLLWIGAYRPDCHFTTSVGRLFPEPPADPRVLAIPFDRFGEAPPAPGLLPSPDGLLYRWAPAANPPRWHAYPAVRLGRFPSADPLRNLMAASWLDRKARYFETTGNRMAAIGIRMRLAMALPRDALTRGLLGSSLLGIGDFATAMAPLDAAVALAPGEPWWRFLRGAALLRLGREAEARPELAAAGGHLRGSRRGEARRLLAFWGFPGYAVLFAGEGLP